jgi:hypothetical protein
MVGVKRHEQAIVSSADPAHVWEFSSSFPADDGALPVSRRAARTGASEKAEQRQDQRAAQNIRDYRIRMALIWRMTYRNNADRRQVRVVHARRDADGARH